MRHFLPITALLTALVTTQAAGAHGGHGAPGGFSGFSGGRGSFGGAPVRPNLGRPAPRTVNGRTVSTGPTRTAARGRFSPQFVQSARRFSGGFWFRQRMGNWSRQWSSRYGCWCWWCPTSGSSYYWCAPYGCYFPVTYNPTGSYNYPDPSMPPPAPQGAGPQTGPGPQTGDPQPTDSQPPAEDPAPIAE